MATKVIKKINKKNQDELRNKLGGWYLKANLGKEFASGIETEDGKICLITKPSQICKYFWLAEGRTRGISEGIDLAEKAKHDRKFFISKNVQLAGYEFKLKSIAKVEKGESQAFIYSRTDCKGMSHIRFANFLNLEDTGLPPCPPGTLVREVTDEELQAYKQAVLAARDTLIKRLHTYLNRYGMYKITTDTCWDEE